MCAVVGAAAAKGQRRRSAGHDAASNSTEITRDSMELVPVPLGATTTGPHIPAFPASIYPTILFIACHSFLPCLMLGHHCGPRPACLPSLAALGILQGSCSLLWELVLRSVIGVVWPCGCVSHHGEHGLDVATTGHHPLSQVNSGDLEVGKFVSIKIVVSTLRLSFSPSFRSASLSVAKPEQGGGVRCHPIPGPNELSLIIGGHR